MKPKEFDDLVRQKFDQNDFAYSPANWDRLAEQMDGKDKKRGIFMWLGLPLAGMAASVALAMGVTTLLRQGEPQQGGGAATYTAASVHPGTPKAATVPATQAPLMASAAPVAHRNVSSDIVTHKNNKRTIIKDQNNLVAVADNSGFHIRLRDIAPAAATPETKLPGTFKNSVSTTNKANNSTPQRKKIELVDAGYKTFLPDEVNPQQPSRFSVILSGGLNKGNRNNGFSAGATVRRMINEKVFVEGEVAFTGSSNTQSTSYFEQTSAGGPVAMGKINPLTASTTAAKTLSEDVPDAVVPVGPTGVIKQKDVSYNLYYAAVTPSIGYKIVNRLSVSAGPDFQKALVDNRPAPSAVERGTIQVAPLFDVGMVGKTECAITKQLKAGIAYRKGVNNVLTPMGKYIDRDYVQFQIKWAILNK